MASDGAASPAQGSTGAPQPRRDDDAIYQNGQIVARVVDPEVDPQGHEVRFAELYKSEHLVLPDECEFRQHRLIVRKIGFATKSEREALERGRILRNVTAEILGDRRR